MTLLVPITLFTWPLVVVALFACLRPSLATAYAFAAGWCFLPVAGYSLPGVPDYTKSFATIIGVLLGIGIFSPSNFLRLRPSVLDLPSVILCCAPFVTSITNGLGPYDGMSAAVNHCVTWGLPYWIGRCTYTNYDEIADLTQAIIVCGLIYVPLCLWEVKMSPQLHRHIYGYQQHSFAQTFRGGGWRPVVFMQHGLQVAMWMCGCLILCFSQWWIGRTQLLCRMPMTLVFTAFGVTFLLLKSTGAYALALLGFVLLLLVRRQRASWPLLAIPLLVVLYLAGRTSEIYTGRGLEDFTREYVGEARADSLKTRLDNEDRLIAKAKEQWLFGWGGWGRNRVYNDRGRDITITDGLWIIVFGVNGMVGLSAWYAVFLGGPCAVALFSPSRWRSLAPPDAANLAGLSTICSLSALDSLPNAMVLPIFTVTVGALVTIANRKAPRALIIAQVAVRDSVNRKTQVAGVQQTKS